MGGSLALRGLVSSKGLLEHAFFTMFQLRDRREGREVILPPGAAPMHADCPHQVLEGGSPFLTMWFLQAKLCSEQMQEGRVKGQTPSQGSAPK